MKNWKVLLCCILMALSPISMVMFLIEGGDFWFWMIFGSLVGAALLYLWHFKPVFYLCLLFSCGSVMSQNMQGLPDSAYSLTKDKVTYNPAYVKIAYPNGDVPANTGVCTDVIIRAYRKVGVDLQKLVHQDMVANFNLYPTKWGRKSADSNIDHRRVANLMTFFNRYATIKAVNTFYYPGDIVVWDLGRGILHIGILSTYVSKDGSHHLVIHNIGKGQIMEDCLYSYRIIAHYKY